MAKRDMFDHVVRTFIDNDGGFLLVSADVTFMRTFKALLKMLGTSKDCMHCELNSANYLLRIGKMLKHFKQIVLFIEASIDGKNTTADFQKIKDVLGDRVVIICLSSEMDRDLLSLFYDMGADNIIVKPISINSIIEKIVNSIEPNSLRSLVDKTKAAIAHGEYTIAKQNIDKIITTKQDSSIAQILLGDIYRINKNFEDAEQCYKKASSNSKMYLEPLQKLTDLYDEIGDNEKKVLCLKKMDRLSPLNHRRKIVIGDIYVKLGDVEHSQRYYEDAVKVVRKHAHDEVVAALMDVGKKLMVLQPEQGLKFMSEAMSLKAGEFTQNDMWMFNEIGMNLRKQGQWERAVEYYIRALDVDPENGGLLFNMAMAYLQGKQYSKAKKYVDEALDTSPELLKSDASIPYQVAIICYYSQNYAEARNSVKMTLEMDPGHEGAGNLLKKLDEL